MESIALTATHYTTSPGASSYTINRLDLDWGMAVIRIYLLGNNGQEHKVEYSGADATAQMVALNKANLSTKSLQKRVIEKLVADGKLAGTITGTPD